MGAVVAERRRPPLFALTTQAHRSVERRWAIGGVAAVVVASAAPTFAGYLRAPPGWTYTGVTGYVEDAAQHEVWAQEMARHGRYVVNLLTPEPTGSGWLLNPLELLIGLLQRGTGLPYPVVSALVGMAMIPALAWGLLTLARNARLPRPGLAVLIAVLVGSLAPLGVAGDELGLLHVDTAAWVSYGGDATPISAGAWVYLTLAVLTLVALLRDDVVSGFRRAGAILFVLGAVYPFFLPVLWLTAGLYALALGRSVDRRALAKGLVWFALLSLPPALYYGLLLPHFDPEFARFARLNHRPIPTLATTIASLGLGSAALLGAPRLVSGNRTHKLLGCLAVALVVALYVPQHPWRSHLFYLSPLLVLGAVAAWWPVVRTWRVRTRVVVVVAALAATSAVVPYNYIRNLRGLDHVRPPQFLTAGDAAGMSWLKHRPGDGVVLARSDISPWVAARAGHRVLVGHYLWTRDWARRRREVDAAFDRGRDPQSLLVRFEVEWILLDRERGVPAWADGVRPVARFGETTILRAADVLNRS